eukprot:222356_1
MSAGSEADTKTVEMEETKEKLDIDQYHFSPKKKLQSILNKVKIPKTKEKIVNSSKLKFITLKITNYIEAWKETINSSYIETDQNDNDWQIFVDNKNQKMIKIDKNTIISRSIFGDNNAKTPQKITIKSISRNLNKKYKIKWNQNIDKLKKK